MTFPFTKLIAPRNAKGLKFEKIPSGFMEDVPKVLFRDAQPARYKRSGLPLYI